MQKKWKIPVLIAYALLGVGILRLVWGFVQMLGPDQGFFHTRYLKITVSGEVGRPGVYRISEGTTKFELLQAAGVRPSSDLSNINLLACAVAGELDVPRRDQTVGIASPQVSPFIESQSGDIIVAARDGTRRTGQEGAFVTAGDTIRTSASAEMELSMGPLSRLSVEELSEFSLDTIRFSDGNATCIKLTQRSGAAWYRVALGSGNYWQVTTPPATIEVTGSGAEFRVEVQADGVSISCTKGNLSTEKSDGESVIMSAGQAVMIYRDNRPMQLSHINTDSGSLHQFTRGTTETVSEPPDDQQLNFLFCGIPYLFLVVRFQPGDGVISIIHIPPQLQVTQFAQGVSTLDQAYLYGGPTFVGSILGRLLKMRITKYCSVSKASALQLADLLGGIKIENGSKISGRELRQYLLSASNSPEQGVVRQLQLFNAVFDEIRNSKSSTNLPALRLILGKMENDIDPRELMDRYLSPAVKGAWTRRDIKLPVQESHQNGNICYQPDLDQCRELSNQ